MSVLFGGHRMTATKPCYQVSVTCVRRQPKLKEHFKTNLTMQTAKWILRRLLHHPLAFHQIPF